MFQSYIEKVNQLKIRKKQELHEDNLRYAETNIESLLSTLRVYFPVFYRTFTEEMEQPTQRLDYVHNIGYINLSQHVISKRNQIIPSIILSDIVIGLYKDDLIVGKWEGYDNPIRHTSLVNREEGDIRLGEALNYIEIQERKLKVSISET